ALLHRVQPVVDVVEVDVAGDDRLELRLRGAVVVLAAPEGVVAVEADQPDGVFLLHPASLSPSLTACRTGRLAPACRAGRRRDIRPRSRSRRRRHPGW